VDERTIRIVISGGGTGGHVYPALAVADELRRRHPRARVVFVGTRGGLEERLVPRAGYPLRRLRLAGMQGAGPAGKLVSMARAAWAVLRCVGWMARERPDLVIGVGGYVSGPAVLAGRLLRVPTMLMEQNHLPGATNRWLAPRVDAVCVPSAAAGQRLEGRVFVTGNPVRNEFFGVGEPPQGINPALLVYGGSRGARSINRAVCQALPQLAGVALRIAHQTGADDEEEVRRAYAGWPGEHEISRFFDDMPARLAAAHVVLCRAGAMTISELCAAGRPAILVPYPHAADDHQRHNANMLRDAGAAVVLPDEGLSGGRLAEAIVELARDPARRRAMGQAARRLASPGAGERIADVADALLTGSPQEVRDVP
jgi:UDP-N-acetylglucosamine--N-acetylmuramyl-(pentapeptide) pyrophosphoryl-undecaprenol N-acetylglucosamine transferase